MAHAQGGRYFKQCNDGGIATSAFETADVLLVPEKRLWLFPEPLFQGISNIDLGLLLMSRWNRAEFTLPESPTSQSNVKLRAPLSAREPHFGFPCDAAPLPMSMAIHRYRRLRSGVRSVEVSGRFGLQDNGLRR